MKKVIVVYDGSHFSEGTFEFIKRLNEQSPILVVGVFLPAIDYIELLFSLGGMGGPAYYKDVDTRETGIDPKGIDRFKELCVRNGIEYRVHADLEKHAIDEVKMESRYADLLVLSSELFYKNLGADTQKDYIEDALHKSECPVLLIPENYQFPDNVILAYDASASSVFAIKQFSYLFPALTNLKTTLVYASDDEEIPDTSYIKEIAARHFSDLTISKLDANPRKYFNTWIQDTGNSILVSGAYGRSGLSQMFKSSFIEDVINDHKLPVFIAHN